MRRIVQPLWHLARGRHAAASSAPKVLIDKQGYTQRPDQYGTGSSVSYGLLLKNTSTTQDAKNVYLLVNFVAANGQLIALGLEDADTDRRRRRPSASATK